MVRGSPQHSFVSQLLRRFPELDTPDNPQLLVRMPPARQRPGRRLHASCRSAGRNQHASRQQHTSAQHGLGAHAGMQAPSPVASGRVCGLLPFDELGTTPQTATGASGLAREWRNGPGGAFRWFRKASSGVAQQRPVPGAIPALSPHFRTRGTIKYCVWKVYRCSR